MSTLFFLIYSSLFLLLLLTKIFFHSGHYSYNMERCILEKILTVKLSVRLELMFPFGLSKHVYLYQLHYQLYSKSSWYRRSVNHTLKPIQYFSFGWYYFSIVVVLRLYFILFLRPMVIIFILCKFLIPVFTGGFTLKSECQWFSKSLFSILVVFNNLDCLNSSSDLQFPPVSFPGLWGLFQGHQQQFLSQSP